MNGAPRAVPAWTETVARALGHLAFLSGGLYTLFAPLPKSLRFAAEPVQLIIWVVFMSTAVFAAYAALRGKYLVEYAVLPFMVGGALIYDVAMWAVVLTGENPGSGLAACLTLSLIFGLSARWLSLNQLLDSPLKGFFRRGGYRGGSR